MVAEKSPRLVLASYLAGASCLLPSRADELLERLTAAERSVALQVAQGLSNKEISTVLGKAEPTVKNQIRAILRSTNVPSRCRFIALYHQQSGGTSRPMTKIGGR